MATSFNFYTTAATMNLIVDAVTVEAPGFPIDYAFDNNLSTYWKGPAGAQLIDVDLGAAFSIDAWALTFSTYTVEPLGTMSIYYSDNGSSWTLWTDSLVTLNTLWTSGDPVLFDKPGTSESHRYWRYSLNVSSGILNITQLFLLQERSLAIGNIYPEPDHIEYAVRAQHQPGIRTLKRLINGVAVERFVREFLLTSDAELATLQAVYDDSKGILRPLLVQEDSNNPKVVELTTRRFAPNKIQFQLYKPTIRYQTLPYIEAGENL
jgi:hypothetical protein